MEIILASTSTYRRHLLSRLKIDFRCVAPITDETPLTDEAAALTAARLATDKANSVAKRFPAALVIGSDQIATLDGQALGKPGSYSAARRQLLASAGHSVQFFTAITLIHKQRNLELHHTEPFTAHFRNLDEQEIEYYLQTEEPYDCAGSFKCESLGIALFDSLQGNDPTSLEGLPLIALTQLLRTAGYNVLKNR